MVAPGEYVGWIRPGSFSWQYDISVAVQSRILPTELTRLKTWWSWLILIESNKKGGPNKGLKFIKLNFEVPKKKQPSERQIWSNFPPKQFVVFQTVAKPCFLEALLVVLQRETRCMGISKFPPTMAILEAMATPFPSPPAWWKPRQLSLASRFGVPGTGTVGSCASRRWGRCFTALQGDFRRAPRCIWRVFHQNWKVNPVKSWLFRLRGEDGTVAKQRESETEMF